MAPRRWKVEVAFDWLRMDDSAQDYAYYSKSILCLEMKDQSRQPE